jgi:alpha/beta superfamily hydrolase
MILERPATIPAGPGRGLEAAISLPAGAHLGVVVCHPHPLYGGDMDNPVVTTVARACAEAGLATVRFNFRGVGDSAGAWDEGRGEQQDVRAALAHLRALLPSTASVALAGYSFGAAMAAAVADTGEPLAGLALVAPPLAMRPWQPSAALAVAGPLLVIAGDGDQYCPGPELASLRAALPQATVTVIDGADHFFFTALERLRKAVATWAAALR